MPFIGGGSGGAAGVGGTSLIYRFTVSGSVKASIDTGVDVAQAGSSDWSNGDLLEVYLYARTDEATTGSDVNLTFNNDTAAHYSRQRIQDVGNGTSFTGAAGVGLSNVPFTMTGASATASYFGTLRLTCPDFGGTVGFKEGDYTVSNMDSVVGNTRVGIGSFNFQSTAAITRLKVIPNTGAVNFAIGTQLLIYKRTAA